MTDIEHSRPVAGLRFRVVRALLTALVALVCTAFGLIELLAGLLVLLRPAIIYPLALAAGGALLGGGYLAFNREWAGALQAMAIVALSGGLLAAYRRFFPHAPARVRRAPIERD